MTSYRNMFRAKIHRARVTSADLNYEGSIGIDPTLMEAAGILPYERVQVLNLSNGARAETYAIPVLRDSGDIILNGALARLAYPDDRVIILAYAWVDEETAKRMQPVVIQVDDDNHIIKTIQSTESKGMHS
jgi:aspartate 1-decarboxylase